MRGVGWPTVLSGVTEVFLSCLIVHLLVMQQAPLQRSGCIRRSGTDFLSCPRARPLRLDVDYAPAGPSRTSAGPRYRIRTAARHGRRTPAAVDRAFRLS